MAENHEKQHTEYFYNTPCAIKFQVIAALMLLAITHKLDYPKETVGQLRDNRISVRFYRLFSPSRKGNSVHRYGKPIIS